MKNQFNIEVKNPFIFHNNILTDKCLNAFNDWFFENSINSFEYINFKKLSFELQNTIILQFLEFTGILIGRDCIENYWLENSTFFERLDSDSYDYLATIKTLKDAIIKANEIYNNVAINNIYETIKVPIHLRTMAKTPNHETKDKMD